MTHDTDRTDTRPPAHSRDEESRSDEVSSDAEATATHPQEKRGSDNDVSTDDLTRADGTDAIANPPESTRAAAHDEASAAGSLLPANEKSDIMGRWETIQAAFVDEPRKAVEEADQLVAGLMRRLAETFAETRGELEGQWDRGDKVSTEDLRVTLQRYRSFFERLLRA